MLKYSFINFGPLYAYYLARNDISLYCDFFWPRMPRNHQFAVVLFQCTYSTVHYLLHMSFYAAVSLRLHFDVGVARNVFKQMQELCYVDATNK